MARVGKDIDALCTRCKMVLTHVVVSEVDGVVSKVQCRTCGALHKYRDGQKRTVQRERTGGTRLIKSQGKAAAKRLPGEQQRLWQMKKDALEEDPDIKVYRPDGDFETHDIVQHPKFGLGFVERPISGTRVEILFQEGLKLMAMNTK